MVGGSIKLTTYTCHGLEKSRKYVLRPFFDLICWKLKKFVLEKRLRVFCFLLFFVFEDIIEAEQKYSKGKMLRNSFWDCPLWCIRPEWGMICLKLFLTSDLQKQTPEYENPSYRSKGWHNEDQCGWLGSHWSLYLLFSVLNKLSLNPSFLFPHSHRLIGF